MKLAVIGGTGFNELAKSYRKVHTDYGPVEIGTLELGGQEVDFISRHRRGEVPRSVNYKANMQALKLQGAEGIYAVSAGGRLAKDVKPGHLVVIDDFFGYNISIPTFAEKGLLLHEVNNPPTSVPLSNNLRRSWMAISAKVEEAYQAENEQSGKVLVEPGFRFKGMYVNIEGPGFSTPGEEFFFRTLQDVAIVGQTLYYEARLARQLGIPYAAVAMCTDHSNFPMEDPVDHEGEVLGRIKQTSGAAVMLLDEAIKRTERFIEPVSQDALKHLNPTGDVRFQLEMKYPKLVQLIDAARGE